MTANLPITTRIKKLKCWREVESKLRIGVNHLTVAQWIHSKGELQDVGDITIAAGLAALRGEVVAISGGTADAVDFSEDHEIDEVAELTTLYEIQKARVLGARKVEAMAPGVLNGRLSNDIRIAAELIRSVAQIKTDQRRFPVVRTPKKKSGTSARERYGERVAKVVENPKARNRVNAVLAALLAHAEMDAPEDGEDGEEDGEVGEGE